MSRSGYYVKRKHDPLFLQQNAESQRRWRAKNAEKVKSYDRKRLTTDYVVARNHRRRLRKFGLTPELYDSIVERQRGCCKICGGIGPLVFDHDHDTNKFRGLICNSCNVGLGYFKNSSQILSSAIQYLEEA